MTRLFACLAAGALAHGSIAAPAAEKPGSVQVRVRAEPREGAKPGQGAPPPRQEYGYTESDDVGPFTGVNYKGLRNVVVWLEPVDAPPDAPLSAAESPPITIGVGTKKPHGPDGPPVYALGAGQRVRFRNAAETPLSVYAFDDAAPLAAKGIEPGAHAEWVAPPPGAGAREIEIITDARDDPAAVIVVAPTRFAALTQAGKSVKFDRVPAGEWRVCAWHGRIPAKPVGVEVKPGKQSGATITLTVDALREGAE